MPARTRRSERGAPDVLDPHAEHAAAEACRTSRRAPRAAIDRRAAAADPAPAEARIDRPAGGTRAPIGGVDPVLPGERHDPAVELGDAEVAARVELLGDVRRELDLGLVVALLDVVCLVLRVDDTDDIWDVAIRLEGADAEAHRRVDHRITSRGFCRAAPPSTTSKPHDR